MGPSGLRPIGFDGLAGLIPACQCQVASTGHRVSIEGRKGSMHIHMHPSHVLPAASAPPTHTMLLLPWVDTVRAGPGEGQGLKSCAVFIVQSGTRVTSLTYLILLTSQGSSSCRSPPLPRPPAAAAPFAPGLTASPATTSRHPASHPSQPPSSIGQHYS